MAAVVVERVVPCRSEPSRLWAVITDTERLNRAIGLGRIELSPLEDGGAARYLVKTVSGGFPLEYEERPYEWVENRSFRVERVVRRGLAQSIVNAFELKVEAAGETRLVVRVRIEPRPVWIAPVMRLQVRRFVERIADEFRAIDEALQRGEEATFAAPAPRVDGEVLERVAAALRERLPEEQRRIGERLIELVGGAPDFDVDRLRPFELADRWGEPRRAVLAACLDATVVGLLELCWDVVCPSCRTSSERKRTLAELTEHGGCHLCDIQYQVDLDASVEVTFRPGAGVREVDEGPYCIGGPARTPHVLCQRVLPPRGQADLPVPDAEEVLRAFVRGGAKAVVNVETGAPEVVELVAGEALAPDRVRVAPGGRVIVRHDRDEERHVKLERTTWKLQAATALELTTLPEFRRLFSREVLRPGLTLSVARVALVFTDLTGSTAMYAALGDARAFRIVQEHFDVLGRAVAALDGTLVKTIGDAVMASFVDEANAVRAAVGMQRAFRAWRAGVADAAALRLKVGLHAGPCYVVTANGALDYFGQTVNVAARLQGQAEAGEVVLAAEVARRALSEGWLEGAAAGPEHPASLKGVEPGFRMVRVPVDFEA